MQPPWPDEWAAAPRAWLSTNDGLPGGHGEGEDAHRRRKSHRLTGRRRIGQADSTIVVAALLTVSFTVPLPALKLTSVEPL